MLPRRTRLILAGLAALAAASLLLALSAGSMAIAPIDVLRALFAAQADGTDAAVVHTLRLPRALAAFACGALLALAGALMQVLLRNPLADPYVLGVSGGASVGAMLAILAGLPALGLNASAFAGAVGALLLVFGLARGDGAWRQARLLLGLTGELAVHGAPAMTLTQGHALFVGAGEPLTVGAHGEGVLVSSAHDRPGAAEGSAS